VYPVDEGWRVKNSQGKFLNRKYFRAVWVDEGLIFPTEADAVEQAAKHPGAVAVRYFGKTESQAVKAVPDTAAAPAQGVLRESVA
jgi:hypothetical protein